MTSFSLDDRSDSEVREQHEGIMPWMDISWISDMATPSAIVHFEEQSELA